MFRIFGLYSLRLGDDVLHHYQGSVSFFFFNMYHISIPWPAAVAIGVSFAFILCLVFMAANSSRHKSKSKDKKAKRKRSPTPPSSIPLPKRKSTQAFKRCNQCRVRITVSDSHDYCFVCLGMEHPMYDCVRCLSMRWKTYRSHFLRQYLWVYCLLMKKRNVPLLPDYLRKSCQNT